MQVKQGMNVRRFEDVREFYAQVEPYLMRDEVAHNVIIGLCSTLIGSSIYKEPPYLGCVEHEGEIVGVALRTPPHNFLLSSMTDDAALAFAQDAYALYGDLPGALGLKDVVAAFARYWNTLSAKPMYLKRQQRSFRLDTVIPVQGVRGEYRVATEEHFELMVDWWMAFMAEAMEASPRAEAEHNVRSRLDSAPSERGVRLWVDNGKPVSIVGYGGLTPNSIRLGPVYTPPEHRGHGYASAMTAAVSQEMLDRGRCFVTLYTDLSNPTSNHIYKLIGFKPMWDVDEYRPEA